MICLRFVGDRSVRACSLLENEWCLKSDLRCLHCCHSFPSEPIPALRSFDDRAALFHIRKGHLCGWSCAKAFHNGETSASRDACDRLFRALTCISYSTVLPALPRGRLKAFGGDLDIDSFRKTRAPAAVPVRVPTGVVMIRRDPCSQKLDPVDTTYGNFAHARKGCDRDWRPVMAACPLAAEEPHQRRSTQINDISRFVKASTTHGITS